MREWINSEADIYPPKVFKFKTKREFYYLYLSLSLSLFVCLCLLHYMKRNWIKD